MDSSSSLLPWQTPVRHADSATDWLSCHSTPVGMSEGEGGFSSETRNMLLALKREVDAGLVPKEMYEEECRKAISAIKPKQVEPTQLSETQKKEKEMRDKLEVMKKDSSDDTDKRKFNRGVDHRRSYTKEEKLMVIILKESGKSADEVAFACRISRSNVEKWTTEKTKLPIVEKCKTLLQNGMFTKSSINFSGLPYESLRQDLFNSVIKCFPNPHSSLDPRTIDLLIGVLSGGQGSSGASSASYAAAAAYPSSSSSGMGFYASGYPGSSSEELQLFEGDLSEFGDLGGDMNSSPDLLYGLAHQASSLPSHGGSMQPPQQGTSTAAAQQKKAGTVRKASKPAAAAPPAKKSKLMTELLEAATAYYNEADGSSSMNLEDYIRPRRVLVTAQPVAMPAKVLTALSDADVYRGDPHTENYHTINAVSDITMSYDSSMLSDTRFDATGIAASTTTQALRPVIRNTAFLSSLREAFTEQEASTPGSGAAKTVLDEDEEDEGKTLTAAEQKEEDDRIMRFLGERQYRVSIDKNDMRKFSAVVL